LSKTVTGLLPEAIPWGNVAFFLLGLGLLFGDRFTGRGAKPKAATEGEIEGQEQVSRMCTGQIVRVNFADLWDPNGLPSPDPRIEIVTAFQNHSPWTVLVNGVRGKSTIGQVPCPQEAEWPGSSAYSRSYGPFSRGPVSFSQPL